MLYNTIKTEYKVLLRKWHKGTGGDPGLDMYFELWSQSKKDKYDINLDIYDHTNVADRLPILIENYIQNYTKKPCLTVFHMWDEKSSNLLSSKHDPFHTSKGEICMLESSNDKEE